MVIFFFKRHRAGTFWCFWSEGVYENYFIIFGGTWKEINVFYVELISLENAAVKKITIVYKSQWHSLLFDSYWLENLNSNCKVKKWNKVSHNDRKIFISFFDFMRVVQIKPYKPYKDGNDGKDVPGFCNVLQSQLQHLVVIYPLSTIWVTQL